MIGVLKMNSTEERLASIETTLTHLATTDDLSKMEVRMIKWFAFSLLASVSAIAAVLRYLAP